MLSDIVTGKHLTQKPTLWTYKTYNLLRYSGLESVIANMHIVLLKTQWWFGGSVTRITLKTITPAKYLFSNGMCKSMYLKYIKVLKIHNPNYKILFRLLYGIDIYCGILLTFTHMTFESVIDNTVVNALKLAWWFTVSTQLSGSRT